CRGHQEKFHRRAQRQTASTRPVLRFRSPKPATSRVRTAAARLAGPGRVGVAAGETAEGSLELGGPDHLDVRVEPAERGGEADPGPGALYELAALGADLFDKSVAGVRGDDDGGKADDDLANAGPRRGVGGTSEAARDVRGHVSHGQLSWGEAWS